MHLKLQGSIYRLDEGISLIREDQHRPLTPQMSSSRELKAVSQKRANIHPQYHYPFDVPPPNTSPKSYPQIATLPPPPLEIRLNIKRHAQPGPHLLTIYQIARSCTPSCNSVTSYKNYNDQPTLPAVNREAREETLKDYGLVRGGYGLCMAVNERKDTVYVYGGKVTVRWPEKLVTKGNVGEGLRIRSVRIIEPAFRVRP